jgi:hypothetical protein
VKRTDPNADIKRLRNTLLNALRKPRSASTSTSSRTSSRTPVRTSSRTPSRTPVRTSSRTPVRTSSRTPVRTPSRTPVRRTTSASLTRKVKNVIAQKKPKKIIKLAQKAIKTKYPSKYGGVKTRKIKLPKSIEKVAVKI